jgi:hypothetical protein
MEGDQEGQQPQAPPQPDLNPDLMGYPNVEALVNAKRSGDAEAKRLHEENQQLRVQAQQWAAAAANPRPDIPTRSVPVQDPDSRLSELGVDTVALREFVGRELQGAFAPIQQGFQARNQLLAQYPTYTKYESDVAAFVQSDPELSQAYPRLFAADPVRAMEYAFLKFGENRRSSTPGSGNVGNGEQVHAQIPGSRSGDARRQPADGDLQSKYERWQQTGNSRDAQAFARARLKQVVTEDFLNQ